jgi:hypothetical protein
LCSRPCKAARTGGVWPSAKVMSVHILSLISFPNKDNMASNIYMGIRSCKSFFDHLVTLETKSLLLTSEVLTQRERLENSVQHLCMEIDWLQIYIFELNLIWNLVLSI